MNENNSKSEWDWVNWNDRRPVHWPKNEDALQYAAALPILNEPAAWMVVFLSTTAETRLTYIDIFYGKKTEVQRDMEHFFPRWKKSLERPT